LITAATFVFPAGAAAGFGDDAGLGVGEAFLLGDAAFAGELMRAAAGDGEGVGLRSGVPGLGKLELGRSDGTLTEGSVRLGGSVARRPKSCAEGSSFSSWATTNGQKANVTNMTAREVLFIVSKRIKLRSGRW